MLLLLHVSLVVVTVLQAMNRWRSFPFDAHLLLLVLQLLLLQQLQRDL